MKKELFPFQRAALDAIKDRKNAALFWQMGAGKTVSSIELTEYWGSEILICLVLKSTLGQWIEELKNQTDRQVFNAYKKSKKDGVQAFMLATGRRALVIGYDAYKTAGMKRLREYITAHAADVTMICDESSQIGHMESQRTKAVLKTEAEHRLMLSGTPATGGRMEAIIPTARMLGWDMTKDEFLQRFCDVYLWTDPARPWMMVPIIQGYKNIPELREGLRQHGGSFLTMAEAGVQLPETTEQRITTKTPPEYRRFIKGGIVTINGREIIGDNNLTRMLYTRQICSVYNPEREAAVERIKFIFDEFENVLVSFSGGKDSTVCMDMCYDYAKEHNMLDKLAMYHLDYEAQYQMTTDYVTESFNSYPEVRKWWLCLPIEAQCACRMDGAFWTPWAPENKDIWVRDMPNNKYVINENNAPFEVQRGLTDNEMQRTFTDWFVSQYGRTAIVVGIRCQESYDRLQIITSTDHNLRYKDKKWTITSHIKNTTHGISTFAYIIYDWQVEDVWTYFGTTGYKYNRLYDLFYQAGCKLGDMRVASPFNDCGIHNLKLYKVIDPKNWAKPVGRVNGANFAGLYGGTTAMGWRKIILPPGHTWKSYCYFLLSTLDEKLKHHYERILATSLKYWCENGGFVCEDIMDEVKALETDYEDMGTSTRYSNQRILKFTQYPDDCKTKSFAKLPSYKRMCICIMKNDYYCTYMGFGKTKEAIEKRKITMEKYKNL